MKSSERGGKEENMTEDEVGEEAPTTWSDSESHTMRPKYGCGTRANNVRGIETKIWRERERDEY